MSQPIKFHYLSTNEIAGIIPCSTNKITGSRPLGRDTILHRFGQILPNLHKTHDIVVTMSNFLAPIQRKNNSFRWPIPCIQWLCTPKGQQIGSGRYAKQFKIVNAIDQLFKQSFWSHRCSSQEFKTEPQILLNPQSYRKLPENQQTRFDKSSLLIFVFKSIT